MADYYVSPDGSDTNDGATLGSPFRTITRAIEEIAELLGVGRRTVDRDWTAAKAWLFHAISGGPEEST